MFDSPDKLALGLLTGIVFGFLLQKGRAAKYHVIVGQFLLKDWTVVKIMLTAVILGSVGVYALVNEGHAVHVEQGAGKASGFSDQEFQNVGAHLVDMSPLSTTGAMCLAGIADTSQVRPTYNKLLAWGLSMTVIGAVGCYLFF